MSTVLLIIIYIAFIGLGLPDSLFGTAWPAIYNDFNLPISFGSFVTSVVSIGTIISSLISSKLISKLGTSKVCAYSTLLTALALLGFSFSKNIWCMVLLAVPLGIGAGAIDVALNNYVALHYSSSQMSFLHCFYGVGVSLSPYILSLVISGEHGWKDGYQIAFIIQLFIALLIFVTLPLWKKVKEQNQSEVEKVKSLSLKETISIPGVKYMCALFFITCAIECILSAWGSTFLVEVRGLSSKGAAQAILFYFIGMALGRFMSGVLAVKLKEWKIIIIGMSIMSIGVIFLFIPNIIFIAAFALFLIGLGNGPMFPNYTHLAPLNFGKSVSQEVISLQMAFAYIGILMGPLVCGLIGEVTRMKCFPFFILFLFILMLLITYLSYKLFAKKNRI